ncbi:MAG: TSCPD domain-containing protein [Candidatus Omnitrophica bacterium]|nr:TSCPD domain-containing protein [Candidatus Omnitrophota bacterium]
MQVNVSPAKKVHISENCLKVLERRYLKKDKNGKVIETPEELFVRVSSHIAQADRLYGATDIEVAETQKNFYKMMTDFEFMPNSPTLMNAGKELAQLSACFVLPIGDSMESIFDAIKNTAMIHKSGGGTGFSFSRLRQKNSVVRSTGGVSSGPVSFMKVFNAATQAVKQGGTRRGANMGILRVDHPDVLEFIKCKENDKEITNFNISIAITEDFMNKVINDEEYNLIDPHTKKVVNTLKAKEVFDLIVEMAWKNGEPGIVFIDRINQCNPTPGLGEIESTNPCVTGDTLVSTEHGLMKMEDVVKFFSQGGLRIATDDRIMELLYSQRQEGEGSIAVMIKAKTGITFNPISKAFYSGQREVFRLVTESGYELEATGDHKVMTTEGWVKLKDLRQTHHKILIQSGEGKFNESKDLPFPVFNNFIGNMGKRYKFNFPSQWTKELGQVLGWTVGDGWLRQGDKNCRLGLTFSKDDEEILNYFKPIINDWYGHDIKEVERENGVTHLSYHGKYFIEFFTSLGVKPWQSDEKKVPESIYTAPKEAVIGFLQGLFSADGTVNFRQGQSSYVRLTAKSLGLLKGVQLLLLNLGIRSRIYDRSRKGRYGFEYVTKQGERKEYYLDGICYELEISREAVMKFLNIIGFLCGRHQEKIKKFYSKKYYKDVFAERVKSKEKVGKKMVYDLTENRSNSFIANGLCISNCGEQPLLPFESCNLGSINLSKVVSENNGKKEVDWEKLKRLTHLGVHFLDNVIDMNKFPLAEIEQMTRTNRKIGLGIMGWADMLIQLEIAYNSDEAVELAKKVMNFIDDEAKKKSEEFADKRGAFPAYNDSVFSSQAVGKRRNATLTTIAPTGTISIISNVSSGIEPLFALSYYRNVMDNDKLIEVNSLFEAIAKKEGFYSRKLMEEIAEKGSVKDVEGVPEKYKKIFVTSHDIAPLWHIRMQAVFQKHTDNAVSKTVNFPHDATRDDIREVYMLAYKQGCKGVTIYRDKSREEQVLNISAKNENTKDQVALVKDNSVAPRPRPVVTTGTTTKVTTGCGNLYVTINVDDHSMPFEVFIQMGKAGGCAASQLEAVGRLVSLALRSGVENKKIIDQLRGIRCPSPSWQKGGRIFSCADAIARVLELRLGNGKMYHEEEELEHRSPHTMIEDKLGNVVGVCPDCGAALRHEEGCVVCRSCGYSKC